MLGLYARCSVYLTEGGNMDVDIINMVKFESTIHAVPREVGRLLLFLLFRYLIAGSDAVAVLPSSIMITISR